MDPEQDTQELKADIVGGLTEPPIQETAQQVINTSRRISEAAIPIPPSFGELMDRRYRQGLSVADAFRKDWEASVKALKGELSSPEQAVSSFTAPQENIIKTTVETLVDYTYMRNPSAEFSALDAASEQMADVLNKALQSIVNKKAAPGINLRPKVIKQIIYSHLTNLGCLKLEFQKAQGSLEEAQKLYMAVQEKIKETKSAEEAAEYFELLDIMHRELEMRNSFGVSVKVVSPFNLLIDPTCQDTDPTGASWIMEVDALPIGHIKAEYMIFDEEQKVHRFRYDDKTVFEEVKGNKDSATNVAVSIIDTIFPEYEDAQRKAITDDAVPVIWVYDRPTKKKYLYLKDRFDVPLWVFEDELELSRFFPYFFLAFSTPLNSILQRSEVSHYIPFQTQINKIAEQETLLRTLAFSLFIYNSTSIDKQEVERLFTEATKGTTQLRGIGVKLKDPEAKLEQAIKPFTLPSAQMLPLFDKTDLRSSAERMSRISEALKGAEFRTNTTNDAIATYNNFAQTRLEGITDKIEACVEELFWAIAEIVVSKYDKDTIVRLVSPKVAENFVQMTVPEFNDQFSLAIAAGSSEKPTSLNKKKEAMTITQMLGQFGTAAPITVLRIVSKLLRSAFSKSLVTDEDLEMLLQEGMAAMQKGISTAEGETPPPNDAEPPPPQQ